MQLICFRCNASGEGEGGTSCACGFPLIARAAEQVTTVPWLAVDELLERTDETPLPGVSPEPRKAQLLMERRRRRAAARVQQATDDAETQRAASLRVRRDRRRRTLLLGEVFAAGALAAIGVLLALGALQ